MVLGASTILLTSRAEDRFSISAAERDGRKPTDVELQAKKATEEQRKPAPEELEQDAKKWRGNPLGVIAACAKLLLIWHGLSYYDPAAQEAA